MLACARLFNKIIVELKAVEALHEKHSAQLMNYLKATGYKLGLLVNFCAYPKAPCLVGLLTGGSMAADISQTCISIAAFSAAEGVSEHSVVKISTKNLEEPILRCGENLFPYCT